MSDTAKTLMGTFGMTDYLMPLILEDLSDEDARTRSRGGEGPSIAWMVGHLMHYRYYMLDLLGQRRENPLGETFTKSATDGADYPGARQLQEQWASLASDFQSALMRKTEEEWNGPGAGAHDEKTLRDQITFFAWHEGYHMGAIGALRKAMGLPGPAEKVMAARQEAAEAGA